MRALVRAVVLLAGLGAGAAVVRALAAGRRGGREWDRWLVVTVDRPPEEVSPDRIWPEPLTRLGQDLEVVVRPAPGDRGSELALRPREARVGGGLGRWLAGDGPREEARAALRDAKALLEAGEVIEPDWPPTTRATLGGRLLDAVIRRARREGVL